jgi:outer membrane protein assembly factor BamB
MSFMRACSPRTPLLSGCLAIVALIVAGLTRGQDKAPAAAAKDVLPFGPGLMLPTDASLLPKLQAIRDYVASKQWDDAATLLQSLLDRPEDVLLPVTRRGPDGDDVITGVSLRAEVKRLLAALPKPGVDAYEAIAGKRARQELLDARGEPTALAGIVQRYPQSAAGRQAAMQLAEHYLDRGQFALAAGYFDHLLRAAENPQSRMLFQAALAYRRAGNPVRAEQTWQRLTAAAPEGIVAGGQTISLADLDKELKRTATVHHLVGSEAFRPAVRWPHEGVSEGPAAAWLHEAVRREESAAHPLLPPITPLVVGGKVVYRSDQGLRAIDSRTGAVAWECPSELALANLVREPACHAHVGSWIESYLSSHANVLLENTLLGTLSTDSVRVFAVEDLPVPPRPGSYFAFHESQGQGLALTDAPDLADAVSHSRLLAIDASSGRVAWELGGPHSPLRRDCYFLGPPLPLGGKLYVAVQRAFDLRLLCLEPLTGEILWGQTLATFKSRLAIDGGRRLHAVRLAYGDGLLVCPSNAGGVVAYDLIGRSLAWAHAYREEPPPPDPPPFIRGRGGRRVRLNLVTEPPNLTSEWKVSAPTIADGKMIVAPPDAPEMRCLDLHEGTLLWTRKRGESDLFVAGAAGGVVAVVGKSEVRGIGLANGKLVWRCDIPTPAGQGMAQGDAYQLPVRGPEGHVELLTLDIAHGEVASRLALSQKLAAESLPLPEGFNGAGPGEASLAGLVEQLGSDLWTEREAAGRALEAAGPAAFDALRNAVGRSDPETRRRAIALLREIEHRRVTAQLLEPRRLHLRYNDTPLAEAVADFGRKAGVIIKLARDAKDADRKITLDTGSVTFWQAFDQFCEKAGLVEVLPPLVGGTVPLSGSSVVVVGGMRGGGTFSTDILRTTSDEKPLELTLTEGRPITLPTALAGGMRVRVVPPDTSLPDHRKLEGEIQIGLDVVADGRVQCQKAVGLRIDRALDEQGLPLSQVAGWFKPATAAVAGRSGVTINGMPVIAPPDEPEGLAARLAVVHLKSAGDRQPHKLREVAGAVVVQVRTLPETLVSVPKLMEAVGRTERGRHGGAVRVVEAVRDDDGRVRIKAQVEGVLHGLADVPPNPLGGTILVNGRRLGDEDLLSSLNFALRDEQGKPFRVLRAVSTGVRTGAAHEYEFLFEAEAGQGEPARFEYVDRRTLFVEVPFLLKDVPLP